MRYKVMLTAGAENDLEELHDYIAKHNSPGRADYVLDWLMEVADSLDTFRSMGLTRRNCWRWAFANIDKPSSSPTG